MPTVLPRRYYAFLYLDKTRALHPLHVPPHEDGESPEIHAFLGTSRLEAALDKSGATVAFHGQAHNGPFKGQTPGGVPVFNVSLPVLEYEGFDRPYFVVEV